MTRTAADVEREVEASRSDLDRTVGALRDKMTPGQIFDEASHAMGGAGKQVLSKFVEQAKENPMPLAVMGLGLAWLMTSSGKKSHASDGGYNSRAYGSGAGYEPRSFAPDGGDSADLGDKIHAAGDKASDLLSGAKDRLSGATGAAADSGRRAMHDMGAAAGTAVGKVGDYGRQAQQSFGRLIESEPLLLGAAGLLVGAAIGAALPSTEMEDRTVGRLRDKALEKGRDLAQDSLQQAGDVAQAAYGSVKDELQHPTGEGADPVQHAKDVARNAVQAGRDQLQGPAS